MAPQRRFNPPPNWPAPPTDWAPGPGWQPDPAWGPPPAGWALWVTERPNPHPFRHAFLAAGIWWAVSIVVAVSISQDPASLPYQIGSLTPTPIIAAVVTGLIARSRPKKWAIWTYLFWTVLCMLALPLITVAGKLGT